MKSFSVLAGLVGLASAGNWNGTWPQSSSSASSSSSSVVSSSSSIKPSGWVSESSPSIKPTGWVPEHSSVATSSEQNATSTLITYVTTTVCPATSIISGHTSTYLTTSTLTVTSCKGSCHKPTEAPTSTLAPSTLKPAENVTSTEVVYTTTSLCPITTVQQGHTFTYTSTSTFVVTSCKGGCTKSTEAPKQPSHSSPAAPYPVWNATTQGHAGPSGIVPSGWVPVPSPQTKTVTDIYTTVISCSSGQVITTGGSKTTLTAPSVITQTLTSKSTVSKDLTITPPTQGQAVPTTPIYSNGTTTYITTTYLTTCPVTSEIVTGGSTKTSVWTTVSTATTVIKVSKTAPIESPAVSTISPVGSGKVTVVVPVIQYTTTCPYTTVDQHGSTSVFLTTSIVSHPAQSTKAIETHPAAPTAVSTSGVPSSKPVESAPAESHPASSPVSPVQSSKPVESAPATTPAASSIVKPSGSVVTQISDGQIQVPGPSSVASVLSSSVHANAPSSTSGTVASATTSLPATYSTGAAAGKNNASFMAAIAAMAAVFFF